MRIGLGLALTAQSGGVGGGSGSVIDTSDLTFSGEVNGDELIDTDSFRIAKEGTGAAASATASVANATYNISYDVSAYDGGKTGITLINVRLYIDGVLDTTSSAAGSVNKQITVAAGSIEFRAPNTGRGGRVDNLLLTVS